MKVLTVYSTSVIFGKFRSDLLHESNALAQVLTSFDISYHAFTSLVDCESVEFCRVILLRPHYNENNLDLMENVWLY